jgi:hypothetical protein
MVARVTDALLNNGNSSKDEVTITRGMFVAALNGLLNAALIFVPINDSTKAVLAASLNPTMIIVASVLFAVFDKWYDSTFGG